MNTSVFTVIVGDLYQSRKLADRSQFSNTIIQKLGKITGQFHETLYAPPILTKGIDELSIVLSKPDYSYKICRTLNDEIFPHYFRFAIVTGYLDVAIESHHSGRMDGEAFHIASNLIQTLKKDKLPYIFQVSDNNRNRLITTVTNLVYKLQSKWTTKQHTIATLYNQCGNQQSVAKQLNISQQSVSQSLIALDWKEINNAIITVDDVLMSAEKAD